MIDHNVRDPGQARPSPWSHTMRVTGEIAYVEVASLGLAIDDLTPGREPYVASSRHGT